MKPPMLRLSSLAIALGLTTCNSLGRNDRSDDAADKQLVAVDKRSFAGPCGCVGDLAHAASGFFSREVNGNLNGPTPITGGQPSSTDYFIIESLEMSAVDPRTGAPKPRGVPLGLYERWVQDGKMEMKERWLFMPDEKSGVMRYDALPGLVFAPDREPVLRYLDSSSDVSTVYISVSWTVVPK